MNYSFLIGRLVEDPKLGYTQKGEAHCSFTLAVDRGYKDANGESQADFFPIQTWRALAENCSAHLKKGTQVAVSGPLRNREYTAQDGSKRKVTEVVAERVKFLSGGRKANDGGLFPDEMEADRPF